MIGDSISELNLPGFLPVLLVVLVIMYEYIIYTFWFIKALYETHPILSILICSFFQIIVVFLWWSYYKAIFTSPGHVPYDINEQYQDLEDIKEKAKRMLTIKLEQRKKKKQSKAIQQDNIKLHANKETFNYDIENQQKSSTASSQPESLEELYDPIKDLTQVSFCFKCKKVKLARTHHCKECKKCIIRMDHHCPWVGNCVGQKNHKFFILFLLYATISTGQCCISIFIDFIFGQQAYKKCDVNGQLHLTLCCVTTFALSMCIGFLFYFQVSCLLNNITTIETHIEEVKAQNPFKHPTVMQNIAEVFGEDTRTWLLPLIVNTKYRSDSMIEYAAFDQNQKN